MQQDVLIPGPLRSGVLSPLNDDQLSSPEIAPPASPSRVEPDAFYGQILNERFQLSDVVLGSGSFGHAFVCYDYTASKKDRVRTCIAKVETVPTMSCFNKSETQLEHEYNVYTHLHKYPKLRKYLPKIHLFLRHQLAPTIQVPVMVMERVGKDLLSILIDQNTPYYQLRTLGLIGVQLVKALKYMHEMFVVHRDIKPQNIMLVVNGPRFEAKLIDFGLSMPIPGPTETDREPYRSSTCTLAFASWRQHFRHVCSARTDVESFLYTWIFLAGTPIPWRDVPNESQLGKAARREYIGHVKKNQDPVELCAVFDAAGRDPCGTLMSDFLARVKTLHFDERPPYSKMLQYFTWLSNPI